MRFALIVVLAVLAARVPEARASYGFYVGKNLTAIEATAASLLAGGRAELASAYLTEYSTRRAMDALELGRALLSSIEARTKLLYGIRRPAGTRANEPADGGRITVTCRSSVDKPGPVVDPKARPEPPPPIHASAPGVAPGGGAGDRAGGSPLLRSPWGLVLGAILGLFAGVAIHRRRRG